MTAMPAASERILGALRRARRQALSVPELAASVRDTGVDPVRLDVELAALEREGRIVVLEHGSPDPHLDGTDLRTVGAVEHPSRAAFERARRGAEAHWDDIVRAFLASHRCT